MRVYFAHPVTDYGTDREAGMILDLEAMGFEVVNPNSPEHEAGYKVEGMAYFLRLCTSCHACAYATFPHGGLGAGVGKEVQTFVDRGAPVFRLGNTPEAMSVEHTRAVIREYRL